MHPDSHFKFLGVILDRALTFQPHVDLVARRIKGTLGALKQVVCLQLKLRRTFLAKVFKGAILPKLFYAAPVWVKATENSQVNSNRLASALRAIALLMTKCEFGTETNLLLSLADIDPPEVLLHHTAVRLIISLHHLHPNFLGTLTPSPSITTINRLLCDRAITLPNLSNITPKFHPALVPRPQVSLKFDNFRSVTSGDILVFTDGSLIQWVGTGSGYALFDVDKDPFTPIFETYHSLSNEASVYVAELVAIDKALAQLLANMKTLFPKFSGCIRFYVDSQAALLSLKRPYIGKKPIQVYDIIRRLGLLSRTSVRPPSLY